MKSNRVTIAFALVLASATPSFAAPPEVEKYCWALASQQTFMGRGEREAFIANCIADNTPTPQARRRYKKPR